MKTNEDYCGSSMCRNGCTSMLNFDEPCSHYLVDSSFNTTDNEKS